MSAPAEIYGLYCPRTGALRYIGKARRASARLRQHLRECRRRDYPVHRWIRKLLAEGLMPRVEVLARTPDWRTAEREAIQKARAEGLDLLNVADGGDEPFCSLEVRRANGRATAWRLHSVHSDPRRRRLWKLKQALGHALRDGVVSAETKAKMRARPDLFGQWGSLLEDEQCQK
jgi:hypothetical protein